MQNPHLLALFPSLTTKFPSCSSSNETAGVLGIAGRTFLSFTVVMLYTDLLLMPLKSAELNQCEIRS